MDVRWDGDNADKVSMMRNDNLKVQVGDNMANAPFNIILNHTAYRYTVFFDDKTPRDFDFEALMVQKYVTFNVASCLKTNYR